MSRKLVLAGGGHAHMLTLANLHRFVQKGHEVTVIQPSPFHYYSGMGPGMLGQTYSPENIRFATRRVVEKQGGTFVSGKVERVDPHDRKLVLESGQAIPYDVVSFNIGSFIPDRGIAADAGDIFRVKPIERLLEAQQRIIELVSQKKITLAIVGGGPSSIEIAGNIWRLARAAGGHAPDIKLFTRRTLMSNYPRRIRRKAEISLEARGIAVMQNCPVEQIRPAGITLADGQVHAADIIFLAVGVKPSPVFERSGLPTGPDGGLRVNRYLQCTEHDNIFGGGDCIYFADHPLDRVGVFAVRQNPVLLHNLMAALDRTELIEFSPGGDYLLIFNMGDGTGIFAKKRLVFGGRLAFLIKDIIDRRFIRKFQAIE